MSEATLSVSCPDRKGLVAALSMLLYNPGANILQSQQHVDRIESRFFERIQFDLDDLDIPRTHLEELLRIECGRYDMDWRISYSDERRRVAIFVSKLEHCLWDLLIRHRLGEHLRSGLLAGSFRPDGRPATTLLDDGDARSGRWRRVHREPAELPGVRRVARDHAAVDCRPDDEERADQHSDSRFCRRTQWAPHVGTKPNPAAIK